MAIALHHFFVLTEPGAPQCDLLAAAGMIEGSPNRHPGQGTANRRFFFADAMLELLFESAEDGPISGSATAMRLAERHNEATASPFGLITASTDASTRPPFSGWRYYADYLPKGSFLHVGENADRIDEPLCVHMPFELLRPQHQQISPEPFIRLTALRVCVPVALPSAVLTAVADVERISVTFGQPHLMELIFNDARGGQMRDLRPGLPLVLRW